MNSRDRISEAQHQLRLNNRQMAEELRVSEFWYSKVINGHRPPSEDLLLRLDDLIRRKHIVLKASTADSHLKPGGKSSSAEDAEFLHRGSDATVTSLRARIQEHIDHLLTTASNDVQRLGWIAEQLRQYVSEPSSWGMKERLLQEVLEEQRKKEAAEAQAPRKGHGRAG